MVSYSLK